MVSPIFDVGPKVDVDADTYTEDQKYKYRPPNGQYLLLKEISLGADSGFVSFGRIQARLKGIALTSQAGNDAEIELINGFTLKYETKDRIILHPNENIEISSRVVSNSGKIQIQVVGILMSKEEFIEFMNTGRLGLQRVS